jgi:hypothetical protein
LNHRGTVQAGTDINVLCLWFTDTTKPHLLQPNV